MPGRGSGREKTCPCAHEMSGTGVEGPLDEHVKSPRTLRVAPPPAEPEMGDPTGHSVGANIELKETSGLWRAGRQSVTLRLPMNR